MLRRILPMALLAAAALGLGLGGGATAAAPPAPTFNANLLLPSSSGVAEPSIRSNSLGESFVIGPTGVPAGCKAWRVRHDGSAAVYLGFPDGTLGGGDCDWAVGPKETGSSFDDLAYSSLTLANITTGKSSDDGTSFGVPNVFSQQVAGDDRMWMAADPKANALGLATIYMTYHDVTTDQIELGTSHDGGQTYTQNPNGAINPLDVPAGQWAGGASAGNELGNVVARRDPATGALTLYSIFATPDSALDSAAQGAAGTANFNRVYEAVGTVANPDTAPLVTWHDYEIWHGPAGAKYDKTFPVTDVDAAGRVYAVFTDGNHVYFKTDADGTKWNPAVAPAQLDKLAGGYPAADNTALMPWIAAGGAGLVDVVWYAASGGSGASRGPRTTRATSGRSGWRRPRTAARAGRRRRPPTTRSIPARSASAASTASSRHRRAIARCSTSSRSRSTRRTAPRRSPTRTTTPRPAPPSSTTRASARAPRRRAAPRSRTTASRPRRSPAPGRRGRRAPGRRCSISRATRRTTTRAAMARTSTRSTSRTRRTRRTAPAT